MQTLKRIFGTLAISVLLLFVAWLIYQRINRVEAPTQTFVSTSVSMSTTANAPVSDRKPEAPRYFAPDTISHEIAPIGQALEPLLAASKAGNYRASCRLASTIQLCTVRKALLGPLGRISGEYDKYLRQQGKGYTGNDPAILAKIAERQRDDQRWADMCEGFDAQRLEPVWVYRHQAAVQGHVPSMVDYAVSPGLNNYGILNDMSKDAVGWDLYRQNAALSLRQAADAGNRRAIAILMSVHNGTDWSEGGVSLAEANKLEAARYAYAYRELVLDAERDRITNTFLPNVAKELSAQQLAAAEASAMAMIRALPEGTVEKQKSPASPKFGVTDRCTED
jgi:hypothetical protein